MPSSAGLVLGGLIFVISYSLLKGFDTTALVWSMVTTVGSFPLVVAGFAIDGSPLTIDHGLVIFPYRSVRLKNGTKTNCVPLQDVVAVKPIVQLESRSTGESIFTVLVQGLEVTLADGSQHFLDQSRFSGQGMMILEKIARLHGLSYMEETKKALLGPNRPRFKVFDISRLDGDAVILSKPIPKYPGGKTSRVDVRDVLLVEPVQTPYAGTCHLVTQRNGVRFLVSSSKLRTLGVLNRSAWKAKLA